MCQPLLAGDIGDNARHNETSVPQAGIPWMSGGIGDEARDEMRRLSAGYNVHIVFSDRHGNYLAGIPFKVSVANGREMVSAISDGPLLYLKLPPAGYRVSAMIDGAWQQQRIQAGGSGQIARAKFISRGE